MGDLLMSSPAIAALKKTFGAKITVLTSSMAQGIANLIPCIDEVIVYDVPWVKLEKQDPRSFFELVDLLKNRPFDGAVIFTVFSQNPMPSIMLSYWANIPRRLAYCRENPYHLLTDWVPDPEPYSLIRHQVRRDLELVFQVGARIEDDSLQVQLSPDEWPTAKSKLRGLGLNLEKPFVIIHPGVSEKKRAYNLSHWIEIVGLISANLHQQIVITGAASEKEITSSISSGAAVPVIDAAGSLSLKEFISTVKNAAAVISVNTGTIHIAAATRTPVIVFYALTNPQHTPWKAKGNIFPFDVPEELRSHNEILKYVYATSFAGEKKEISPADVVAALALILQGKSVPIPELVLIR
jgi:ADP-heptose:LPS heptosyltransferase